MSDHSPPMDLPPMERPPLGLPPSDRAPLDLARISEEYFARVHRAALVLCGNPWDADDLAQETFLVAARNGGTFQGRSSIYTWLYGILLNLERRLRRQAGLQRRKLRIVWDQELPQERTTPAAESPIEAAEWKKSLWSIVAELPDGQRQAIVLRYSEHLHYEEIADVLGCPLGTVKSRIFNGMVNLRQQLLGCGESPSRDDLLQPPAHASEDIARAL